MPGEETILPRENLQQFAEILNRIRDTIDEAGLKAEQDINALLREMRQVSPSFTNEFETALSFERSWARFGTGSSAYLKMVILQPLINKYSGNEI